MRKIVLFRPLPNQEKKPIVSAPLSLLTVASLLDKEGFSISIIDAITDSDYSQALLKESSGALCVGVTAITGYQVSDGIRQSEMIKKLYPGLPVIWGGWHPTIEPVLTAENPYVDIVVKGQGEETFNELVHAFIDKRQLKEISGIVFKENGRVINNPDRALQDLNNFPPIPYHLIDVDKYIHMSDMGMRTLDYRITQGCPFQCNFCAEHMMSKRKWVALSPERIFEEFKSLKERYNADSIMLLEDNTFVEKKSIKKLCALMIENKLGLRWGNVNVRANQILDDDELWQLLSDSGCHNLLVGAESGLQEILDLLNKDTKKDDVLLLKKKCAKYNIRPYFSFMIGLPREKVSLSHLEQELSSILDLVDQIRRTDDRQEIFISIYMPYPGTPLFEMALKCGMKKPENLEEWGGIDLTKAYSPWVPEAFARRIRYLNEFIFPYSKDILDPEWDKFLRRRRFAFLVRLAKNVLKTIADWRIRARYFGFPVERWLLKKIKG